MKYGSMKGGKSGPCYSTGKSLSMVSNGAKKVGRSDGLKMSNLSDHAAAPKSKYTDNAPQAKNRRGE